MRKVSVLSHEAHNDARREGATHILPTGAEGFLAYRPSGDHYGCNAYLPPCNRCGRDLWETEDQWLWVDALPQMAVPIH